MKAKVAAFFRRIGTVARALRPRTGGFLRGPSDLSWLTAGLIPIGEEDIIRPKLRFFPSCGEGVLRSEPNTPRPPGPYVMPHKYGPGQQLKHAYPGVFVDSVFFVKVRESYQVGHTAPVLSYRCLQVRNGTPVNGPLIRLHEDEVMPVEEAPDAAQ
jgi:hypothetical protein